MGEGAVMVAALIGVLLPPVLLVTWDLVTSDVVCGHCGRWQKVAGRRETFTCKLCRKGFGEG